MTDDMPLTLAVNWRDSRFQVAAQALAARLQLPVLAGHETMLVRTLHRSTRPRALRRSSTYLRRRCSVRAWNRAITKQ